jgi:hypothetical protein
MDITLISPNITQDHPISLEYHMDITEYHPISHGYLLEGVHSPYLSLYRDPGPPSLLPGLLKTKRTVLFKR